ncbi:MAG: PQQ-binding-like beta-propeller repeat protein [Pirellulaceae bacterium]
MQRSSISLRSTARAASLAMVGALLSASIVSGNDRSTMPARWPGFLGVGASALAPESLPLEWSPSTNIAWQVQLVGTGQSSPVIWDDRVFVTSIDGTMKQDCHVTAISLADGARLWDYKTESAQTVRSNYFQSRSAPTPAVDANGVYSFFETGKVIGLSHGGEEKWVRNLVEEFGEFEVRIGLAASLAQSADAVFVLVDHEGPSYLLAIDKQTGGTKWQTERFSRQSYASPIMLEIAGQQQIVISSGGSVDGYDPESGEPLWTLEGVDGNRSTTPLPFGKNRFLISASPGMHDERLEEAKKSNLAMQVDKTAEGYTTKVLWKTDKAMPSFGSPIPSWAWSFTPWSRIRRPRGSNGRSHAV